MGAVGLDLLSLVADLFSETRAVAIGNPDFDVTLPQIAPSGSWPMRQGGENKKTKKRANERTLRLNVIRLLAEHNESSPPACAKHAQFPQRPSEANKKRNFGILRDETYFHIVL